MEKEPRRSARVTSPTGLPVAAGSRLVSQPGSTQSALGKVVTPLAARARDLERQMTMRQQPNQSTLMTETGALDHV